MIHFDTIQAIREQARIEDVVGQVVTLKKKGANLSACCPFHAEKTPSFAVNPARNIFKCFGCGEGGDSITFLMRTGKTYPDALRHLAQMYNIEVRENGQHTDPQHDEKTKLRATATVLTAHFALSDLDDNPGRRYWTERGFSDDTLDTFQVGYCDGKKPAHVSDAELSAVGAINEKGNMVMYKRSIIPLHDRSGHPVGWAGRTVDGGKDVAKYINSPETVIYQKSRTLYNLHRAAPHIRKAQEIWIVEGYADVMALWQSGTRNAVALCGTALTNEQAAEVRKFNGEKNLRIILALDNETRKGDEGYKKQVAAAALTALQMLVPIGEVVRVEYPKACKDMADVVHRGIDPATLEKTDAIQALVADWKICNENASPVETAEFQDVVATMLANVKRDNVRTIYVQSLSSALSMSPRDLNNRVKELRTVRDTEEQNKKVAEYRHIKVGDEYYQRLIDYDIFTKSTTVVYKRRKRQELATEGVAIGSVERFHDWIIEPSHLNYRRTIEIPHEGETFKFFNSYQPLPYAPKAFDLPEAFYRDPENFDYEKIPEIANVARFFKHIFDFEQYRNRYLKIGWDWVALCYLQPTQRMQALALVSNEEGTGKSTFINLMLAMFGQNAVKTEASRIGQNFNAMSGGKVMQCVEETKDEKGGIENRLKDLITAYEQVVEAKHQDAKVVKAFSKYVFASNHEEGFMKVGSATTRFFVMKVKAIRQKVADFEEKLYLEIPYLLYFLQKRGVLTPKADRLWFDPKLLENEALLKLRQASKDQVQQVMEDLFSSLFLRCEITDPVLYLNSHYLKLIMCAYGGKSYEQKTPVYFQNTATREMRLQYRDTPTKRETIELEGIHSDAWINSESWTYTKKRTQARFIEVPIWMFCTPHDIGSNYAPSTLSALKFNLKEKMESLIESYGVAPSDFLYNLERFGNMEYTEGTTVNKLYTNASPVGEGDKLPF
jgi:DNA primase catalytic core